MEHPPPASYPTIDETLSAISEALGQMRRQVKALQAERDELLKQRSTPTTTPAPTTATAPPPTLAPQVLKCNQCWNPVDKDVMQCAHCGLKKCAMCKTWLNSASAVCWTCGARKCGWCSETHQGGRWCPYCNKERCEYCGRYNSKRNACEHCGYYQS